MAWLSPLETIMHERVKNPSHCNAYNVHKASVNISVQFLDHPAGNWIVQKNLILSYECLTHGLSCDAT